MESFPWQRLARAGWYGCAVIASGIFILSVAAQMMASEEALHRILAAPEVPSLVYTLNIIGVLGRMAAALISLILAGALFLKRPNERMALFLSYFLLVHGIVIAGPLASLALFWPGLSTLVWNVIAPISFAPLLVAFLCIFPNGRFVPRQTRWLVVVSLLYAPLSSLLFNATDFSGSAMLYAIGALLWFALIFTGIYAQIYRYRHVSDPPQRQQTKWVVYGFTLAILFAFLITARDLSVDRLALEFPFRWLAPLDSLGWPLAIAAIPISLTFAVMRYRLYDIDIIINRTLVYGGLTLVVAALYAFSVGAVSVALQQSSQWAGLLLTVGLVAVLYRPLHSYFQRAADRLLGPAPAVPGSEEGLEIDAGSEGLEERPVALSGRWLQLARVGWVVLAVVAVVILLLAIPGYAVRRPMGNLSSHLVYDPTPFMLAVHRLNLAAGFISVLLSYGLALLLFEKRPDDRMALFMAYYLVIHGLLFGGPVEMLEPFWPDAAAVNSFVLMPAITFPLTMTLFAVFPDGRFVPRWTRWPVAAAFLLALVALALTFLLQQSLMDPLASLPVMSAYVGGAAIIIALVRAQVYRYRHVSTRLQRQQTKWVLYGFLVLVGLFIVGNGPWIVALSLPDGTRMPWWLPAAETMWVISTALVPITLAIAMLRYRLYDVDVLINRTLVYGGLTAAVVGLYVLVVGALSTLFQAQGNLLIALVATGLVAVLFQPLRQRLQRWTNRLVYGERDEPFEALARLGRRLEGNFSPQMVYPTIVETIAQALKLPYAAIAVKRGEQYEVVEACGKATQEAVAYPLVHQSAVVGRLLVGRRTPGENFSTADERLLRSFARQAGTAVHALQLMSDLQRSRQQLVTAREEERLRLRRDLHDGLGPALASVAWQAESARELVHADPSEAIQLLENTIDQAQSALTDIRRLVYGLRPPALDELGLAGALEQAVRPQQMDVTIEAPAQLPTLPAAVEVAAYRIVQEALKNAMEHGRAERCVVCLALDGNLCLTIGDDGQGLPEVVTPGVGLVSMRERAEELGGTFAIRPRQEGGTEVEVSLPLESGG